MKIVTSLSHDVIDDVTIQYTVGTFL